MARVVVTVLLALAVVAFVATLPAVALQAQGQAHQGKVVSAADGKLIMTDKDGKNEHTHMIAANTKITLDGKPAKLAELKRGQNVTVTTSKEGDKVVVSSVSAVSTP
jgi:hypothetical protein